MKLDIETINHVGLVVKDRAIAERFYVDLLGFERVPGRPGWLKLIATNAIHLIPLGSGESEHPHHR
jgi:catechol 2,3-dioxygenase-like lactoylglutathione lyase family enzyme